MDARFRLGVGHVELLIQNWLSGASGLCHLSDLERTKNAPAVTSRIPEAWVQRRVCSFTSGENVYALGNTMSSLVQLWSSQQSFFAGKKVGQIVKMAGDGVLKDSNATCLELREYLAHVPPEVLATYAGECLVGSMEQEGFVLQDVVNQVGARLGFVVDYGCYLAGAGKIPYDGLWRSKDGHAFLVEVKKSTSYNFSVEKYAGYRKKLVAEGKIPEEKSSILIVVGTDETGALEAQTRGSKFAWDVRLISVMSLLKLLAVRTELTDQKTVQQIQEVLKPHDYTRVDGLIDVIFSTSEDLKGEELDGEAEEKTSLAGGGKSATYHEECLKRISKHLKASLVKQGRCSYSTADGGIRLLCIVSKEYSKRKVGVPRYWYAFHPGQKEFLEEVKAGYVAFGCGSAESIVVMPVADLVTHLPSMRMTKRNGTFYWHVDLFKKGKKFLLRRPTEKGGVDVTGFLI